MPRRRGARKLALDIMYEHEVTEIPIRTLLDRYRNNPAFEYAALLTAGVQDNLAELDRILESYATHWRLDRMPVIDRNLLRIALFELTHLPDVPVPVAINEAVELARIYSTEDSSRFVNGVLGTIAAERAQGSGAKGQGTGS